MTPEKLLDLAHEARARAYAPYSHYAVGAALLTKDGRVYQGCNIENASFSATNCAERTAFFKAVYDGCYDFAAIAVVGGPAGKPCLLYTSRQHRRSLPSITTRKTACTSG